MIVLQLMLLVRSPAHVDPLHLRKRPLTKIQPTVAVAIDFATNPSSTVRNSVVDTFAAKANQDTVHDPSFASVDVLSRAVQPMQIPCLEMQIVPALSRERSATVFANVVRATMNPSDL